MVNVRLCVSGKMKTVKIPGISSVEDLVKELNINIETVVFLKNGEVVPEFEKLSAKDMIEILDIVSRG